MSSNQTSQTAQRVRRNGSPSTTKQGPLKAVKTFTLKQSNTAKKSSSPSPRESNKIWSTKSPDNRLSPERNSPSSLTHSSSNSSSLSISPNPTASQQTQPQQLSHHCHSKEKTKSSKHSSTSGKWRPNSADNVVPSYLTGQWPKDIIHNYHHYQSSGVFMCDKSTQTADGKEQKQKLEKKKKVHRRSASFGQEDQLKYIKHHLQKSKEGSKHSDMKQRASPVPGNHLAVSLGNHTSLSLTAPASLGAQTKSILISAGHIPRQNMNRYQRNSVEGLNVEIEKLVNPVKAVYVSVADGDEADMVFLKEIPDGHRAPVPEANRLSSTRSVDTQTPSAPLSRPASVSPGMSGTSGTPPQQAVESQRHSNSGSDSTDSKSSSKGEAESSPEPTSYVNSPKFVKSCPFGREPPDGCEKIHVMDEARRPQIKSPMMCAPVMPSQFVFKQSQGSAFCPLIKSYDMPDLAELSQGLTRVLGVSCSSPVLASGMEG